MKDYYYILGLKRSASLQEIKVAYRKLSQKFHPDKNDGDEFFTERFKEILEAYEILSDNQKKASYDGKFSKPSSGESRNQGTNFSPEIEYFKANKSSFEVDEEIIFSWKTINTDKVTIKPFGTVQPIGQRTYKLKDFKNKALTFEIIAENTTIGRHVKTSLTLVNRTYQDLYSHFKKIIASEAQTKSYDRESSSNSSNHTQTKSFIRYDTDKGVVELEPFVNMTGTKAYMNGKPAPDGKYKMGFWDYFIIKNGVIIKS